ncbi:MAG: 5-formyltetrahydrofolate cyclo-ligase [Elusimicrobiota bacterium]
MAKKQSTEIDIKEMKRWLRIYLIKIRQSIPEKKRKISSQEIIQQFLKSSYYKKAKTIATFIGFASEVDTWPLIEKAWKDSKNVLIPVTDRGFHEPYFALLKKSDRLKKTSQGPLEFADIKPPFHLKKIDVVIVPGLGFDSNGYRIGYGGGVYDRILLKTPKAHHIGFFFKEQKLHAIPREKHDLPLDLVIDA